MNIFKQFFVSLYSPKTISTFRFQKIGKTIGYVFILMLISMIFIGSNIGLSISGVVNDFETVLEEDLPAFQFQNGTLTSDIQEPVIKEQDGTTFIFDTTGSVTRDDLDRYDNVIALLSTEAYMIQNGTEETFDYGLMQDVQFSKQDLTEFMDTAKNMLPLIISVIIIVAYIFMTALKFIGITVLALIGLILKNMQKRKVSYRQLWILSAYAVTLPTILFAILELVRFVIPGQFFIYWIIAIFILYKVISNIPLPKKPETEQQEII